MNKVNISHIYLFFEIEENQKIIFKITSQFYGYLLNYFDLFLLHKSR